MAEPAARASRPPLTRERALRAAVAVADAGGLGALTIRALAKELGVKPMAIYHHVAGKDEILDGLVDLVFSEIELPRIDGEWRTEMRRRAESAREVLGRHPWAIGLLESRTSPGPASMRYVDAVLGTLRNGGFSGTMATHAFTLLDAFIYGFILQEAALPFEGEAAAEVTASMMELVSVDEYPHLAESVREHALRKDYDFGDEFGFGLELILDGLEAAAHGESARAEPAGSRKRRR